MANSENDCSQALVPILTSITNIFKASVYKNIFLSIVRKNSIFLLFCRLKDILLLGYYFLRIKK
jgi:hypothetical protein